MLKLFYHLYLILNHCYKLFCLCLLGSSVAFSVTASTLIIANVKNKADVADQQPQNWQLWRASNTLSIEFRNIPHSDLIEIRAKAVIESSLSGTLLFLQQTKNIPQWLHNSSNSEIIKTISETENISLTHFDKVWLVKKREMIIRSHYWQNKDLSVEVTIKDESKNYRQYQSKKAIQINILSAHWLIKNRRKGIIEIEHRIIADPNGHIPKWLANRIALKSMWRTLINIENQLPGSHYQKEKLKNIQELGDD